MSELLRPDIRNVLDKYNANKTWYRNNYQELKQKYRGQTVLIDENIVEGYKDIIQLQERLKKDDIDIRTVIIEHISENNTTMTV